MLQATLDGLERSLRVEHIATFDNLLTCEADDPVVEVLSRPDLADFDFVPVLKSGRVVGVLERRAEGSGSAGDAAKRLDESTLMAAAEPVSDFIRALRVSQFRMVVRRGKVDGIVTRSDIQKLPVRLLVFTLITHMEAHMAESIERICPNESWLDELKPPRRDAVERKRDELGDRRLNIRAVEFTEFADKAHVLLARGIHGAAGRGKKGVKREFGRIERLRNQVAHAATLPEHPADLIERFVDVFESTEGWIDWFERGGATWGASGV